jgi:hypothetical protein
MQVKRHLAKLVDLEYVLVHRGGRGQSFVYELLYDGQGEDGGKFMLGLIDTGKLYDTNRGGPEGDRGSENTDRGISGAGQGHPRGGPGTIAENPTSPNVDGHETQSDPETGENARPRDISQNRNRTGKSDVIDEGPAAALAS